MPRRAPDACHLPIAACRQIKALDSGSSSPASVRYEYFEESEEAKRLLLHRYRLPDCDASKLYRYTLPYFSRTPNFLALLVQQWDRTDQPVDNSLPSHQFKCPAMELGLDLTTSASTYGVDNAIRF